MTSERDITGPTVVERAGDPRAGEADAAAARRTATVITGDRLCTHCGYNLTGQTIMREPEYGLLIARCPECSQVASVTEYPLLGTWANRWAAVLAALYLLFVLSMLGGTVGPIVGMSFAAGELAGEGMSMYIEDELVAWFAGTHATTQPAAPVTIGAGSPGAAQPPAAAQVGTGMVGPPAPGTPVPAAGPLQGSVRVTSTDQVIINSPTTAASFQQWWPQQSRSALLARAGGWWSVINREALYLWIPLGIIGFVAGCQWSIITLRRGVVGRLVIAAVLIGLFVVFGLIPWLTWTWSEPYSSWRAGAHVVGPRMLVYSIGLSSACLVAGLFCGRPLVRGMVRLFLPPRLRSSLAILWTTDGRRPPKSVQ